MEGEGGTPRRVGSSLSSRMLFITSPDPGLGSGLHISVLGVKFQRLSWAVTTGAWAHSYKTFHGHNEWNFVIS